MRHDLDVQGAIMLTSRLNREVPPMIDALRSVSKSELWGILIQSLKDTIRTAKAAEKQRVVQWRNMMASERLLRKDLIKTRNALENRIGRDRLALDDTEDMYVAALVDETDSEEGETIEFVVPDFGRREDADDDTDEDAGEVADPIPLPDGLLHVTNLYTLK
jgi:hypothetical protein